MKTEEFQKLLTKFTEHTQNVRALTTEWRSGVHRVPDEMVSKIGRIVSFLQDKINKGHFCKQDEYLMIYNFQPIHCTETDYLCSLDMLIRPFSKLTDLKTCEGQATLQLVVDVKNGRIVTDDFAMRKIEGSEDGEDETEEADEIDEAVSDCYGSYLEYPEPQSSFAEKLAVLERAYTSMSSEINDKKESESLKVEIPKSDICEAHAGMQAMLTFAYNYSGGTEVASPSSTPMFSPFTIMDNSSSNLRLEMPKSLVCAA